MFPEFVETKPANAKFLYPNNSELVVRITNSIFDYTSSPN